MSGEHIALLTLAATLLGTLVVSTWRFSSLASKLLVAVEQLQRKDTELEGRLKALDEIPSMRVEIGHLVKNHSLIPALQSRVSVLETQAKHSKEWRREILRSRPDTDEDEG